MRIARHDRFFIFDAFELKSNYMHLPCDFSVFVCLAQFDQHLFVIMLITVDVVVVRDMGTFQ